MKVSVQVIVHSDDDTGASSVVREVLTLDRDGMAPDTFGLQLSEAKDLLTAMQDTLVEQQVNEAIVKQVSCPHCGAPRRHKDTRTIVVRSLFGALRLPSPRWWHCCCQDQPTRTFQPLAELLPERTTPELAYLQGPLRRNRLLRHHRGTAGRAAAPWTETAPRRSAPPDPGRRDLAGGRARRRAVQFHRHLPARP